MPEQDNGELGNYILGILKEKQAKRTETARSKQQQDEFNVNKELKLKELQQQQDNNDRTYEQQKAVNEISNHFRNLQILGEQSKIADEARSGHVIPGSTITEAPAVNGIPQQQVSFVDNIIPSFTTQTPQSFQQQTLKDAAAKREMENKDKLDQLKAEEGVKAGFKKDELIKTGQNAIDLEKQREVNREALSKLNNGFKVQTQMRGIRDQTETLKPWLDGISNFTTDDKELGMLDKKQRDAIVDTAKGVGFKTPTELTKTELKGVASTIPTLDNIRRLIDATPSGENKGFTAGIQNQIGGTLNYYNNSELREMYDAVKEQAGLFSRAVGMEKGTTSNADADRAFGILLNTGATKQAKTQAYADLVKVIKNKAKVSLIGYHPHQTESALKLYGIDSIPDTVQKAKEDAVIQKFGGK